jgi:hypothetical protein
MKPIPAVLIDSRDPNPEPMPVIVYAFHTTRRGGTIAVIATPGRTFRTADIEDLHWQTFTTDAPITGAFARAAKL